MLVAYFWSHLIKNITYGVARSISLNSDIAFRVEILEHWGLDKDFSQLGKGLFSIKS